MLNEQQADAAAPQPEHKHSWLGGILQQLNSEFPLSGAETDMDLGKLFSHHEAAPKQEQEHTHSWLHDVLGNIDAKFPLSGGE